MIQITSFGEPSPNCQYGDTPVFPTVCRRKYEDPTRQMPATGTYNVFVVSALFEPYPVIFPDEQSACVFMDARPGFEYSIGQYNLGAWQLRRVPCLGTELDRFKPV